MVRGHSTPAPMRKSLLPLLLGLTLTLPLAASFENAKVEMTVEPQIPARLRMDGMKEGSVILALDITADGRLADILVTMASHQELIRPCLEAARQWRFTPARYEGAPTAARLILTLNLSQTRMVVSRSSSEMIGDWTEQMVGRRPDHQLCPSDEIDRPLAAVHRVSPAYARDVANLGVRGRVRVHFFVDEQGNVRLPAVPEDTHPYLSFIATEAMRAWKFEPPTRRGRPVLVAAVQEFDFAHTP